MEVTAFTNWVSKRDFTVVLDGNHNDQWLTYGEALSLFDYFKADGRDVKIETREKVT